MRFDNKIVLIAGGTRGIGLATAKLFAAEGAHVVIVGRDKDKMTEAVRDFGVRGEIGDVSIAADCERTVARTIELFGRLDVLVNCAGVIFRKRTVEQTSEEEWDTTFDVNVKGTFLMCKYALPALRKRKGSIVNVSSCGAGRLREHGCLCGFEGGHYQPDTLNGPRPCQGRHSRERRLSRQRGYGNDPYRLAAVWGCGTGAKAMGRKTSAGTDCNSG